MQMDKLACGQSEEQRADDRGRHPAAGAYMDAPPRVSSKGEVQQPARRRGPHQHVKTSPDTRALGV